jgi:HEAT repeat protein
LWLALLFSACSDNSDGEIRARVAILVGHEGAQVEQAANELARYGKRSIVTLEAALHTAKPPGRKNIILALRRVGDEEAVPLLAHLAQHDGAPDVRREARFTLETWAKETGRQQNSRAEKARAAIRRLDEETNAEEAG